MQSTGGRDMIIEPYLKFHYNTINSAREYLSRTLNLDDCEEVLSDDNLMRKLEGRPRLVSRVVMKIQDTDPRLSKADVLRDAINESFTQHIKTISEGLLNRAKASEEVRWDKIKYALIVMALAISLDEKLVFRAGRDIDFVNAGICHLQKDKQSDDFYFLLGEPLSRAIVSVMITSIGTSITDVVSAQYVSLLASSVLSPQEKCKFLEKIIATALLEKNAMRKFLEDPDVDLSMQADWAKDMEFTHIHTGKNHADQDLKLLSNNQSASGTLLLPSQDMGHDIIGMHCVPDDQPKQPKGGSRKLNLKTFTTNWVIFGVKSTTENTVSSHKTKYNYLQMDPDYVYCKNKTIDVSPKVRFQDCYDKYHQIYKTVSNTLFVAICMPKPSKTVDAPQWTTQFPFVHIDTDNIHCLIRNPIISSVVKAVFNGETVSNTSEIVFERADDGQPMRKRFKGNFDF
jgi:hypothetical protein